MKKMLLLVCFLSVLTAFGQDETQSGDAAPSQNKRVRYFNIFQAGTLVGSEGYGTTLSVSTIHGLRSERGALGIGIGYDDYSRTKTGMTYYSSQYAMSWKSLPVFLSLSIDIIKGPKADVLFQTNAGYAFMAERKLHEFDTADDVKGGIMLNPSLVYRILSGKHSLYMGAGYKLQYNSYRQYPSPWIWGPPSHVISTKETLQRFEARIGFGWN